MASRYKAFTWNPLGRQTQPRMRAHNIVCIHTMVGSLNGTREMFEQHGYGGTESHFGTGSLGQGDQWQDLAYTADANYEGNSEVISIENEDYGGVFGKWNTQDGNAVPAFTSAQCSRMIDLGYALALPGNRGYGSLHRLCPHDWECYKVGIPAKLIPDTRPGRRGFGYHAQGVAGVGLVTGGVKWSKSYGKTCPGPRRIKQIKEIIIPGIAKRLAEGYDSEDPMAGITAAEIADAIMKAPVGGSANDSAGTFGQGQYRLQSEVMRLADQVANQAELEYAIALGDRPAMDKAIARVRARDLKHPGE